MSCRDVFALVATATPVVMYTPVTDGLGFPLKIKTEREKNNNIAEMECEDRLDELSHRV